MRISDEAYTEEMEWSGLKEHISAKAAWMESVMSRPRVY